MSRLREAAQAMIKAWEEGEHIHKHFFRDLRDALAEPDEVLAEREACAQICDDHADDPVYCGQAIRARGNT